MSLLSSIAELLHPTPPPEPRLEAALARVATLIDPLLRSVSGFEQRLSGPLRHAIGYCDGLVGALPGPIDISRQAFANDPLVHALFATADDVDQMLGRSQTVRDFLAQSGSCDSDHFYALLAARRQQKRQFGMALSGEVIHSEVPQTVLFFSDHTLMEPDPSLGGTLLRLRQTALDSLLRTFQEHLAKLRLEREGLRADMSVERAQIGALRAAYQGREVEIHARHLAELDQRLRQAADHLEPEHLVSALAEFLAAPEPSLHLSPVSVTVDRMGVVIHDAPADEAQLHTLHFPELAARDQRRYLVMLARIERDEAIAAVETVRDQQRRFMLI